MAYNPFFDSKTFWLVGFDDTRAQKLKETIVEQGGSVVFKLDSEISYCVAAPSELDSAASIVNQERDLDIPILQEETIWKYSDPSRSRHLRAHHDHSTLNDNDDDDDDDMGASAYTGDYFGRARLMHDQHAPPRHRSRSRAGTTTRPPTSNNSANMVHSPRDSVPTQLNTSEANAHFAGGSSGSGGGNGGGSEGLLSARLRGPPQTQDTPTKRSALEGRGNEPVVNLWPASNVGTDEEDDDEDLVVHGSHGRKDNIRDDDDDEGDDDEGNDGDDDDDDDVIGNDEDADPVESDSAPTRTSNGEYSADPNGAKKKEERTRSVNSPLLTNSELSRIRRASLGNNTRHQSAEHAYRTDLHKSAASPVAGHSKSGANEGSGATGGKASPGTSGQANRGRVTQQRPLSHRNNNDQDTVGYFGERATRDRHHRRPSAGRVVGLYGNSGNSSGNSASGLHGTMRRPTAAAHGSPSRTSASTSHTAQQQQQQQQHRRYSTRDIDPDSDYFEEEAFSDLEEAEFAELSSEEDSTVVDNGRIESSEPATMSTSVTSLGDDSTPERNGAMAALTPVSSSSGQHKLSITVTEPQERSKPQAAPPLSADTASSVTADDPTGTTAGAQSSYSEQMEYQERLEWQSMLSSVLTGEVILSERRRLSGNTSNRELAAERHTNIWIGLRAIVRGRAVAEESRFVAEARSHVEELLKKVVSFRVESGPQNALEQVTELLHNVDAAERLWPSRKAMMEDEPLYASAEVQRTLDTLNSWSAVTKSLMMQLNILRTWTGSDSLQVCIPVTATSPQPNGTDATDIPDGSGGNNAAADASEEPTFVEQLMKENGLKKTFERSTLSAHSRLLRRAKQDQMENAEAFARMGLPTFIDELAMLIAFPPNLMVQFLRLRLEYAKRITNPTMLIVDQMMEDTRSSLEIAQKVKQEAIELATDAPGWSMPNCITAEYDQAMLQTIDFFFRFLTWKLKGGSKAVYFKEADILKYEWNFISDIAADIRSGQTNCAMQLYKLQIRLLLRIIAYNNSQVFSPPEKPEGGIVRWYLRVMDSVRIRARRLYRVGSHNIQRIENASEYVYATYTLQPLLDALAESDHCLVYTGSLEVHGMYVIASSALADDPDRVEEILNYTLVPPGEAADEELRSDHYVLVIAADPKAFQWNGSAIHAPITADEVKVGLNRLRIVVERPQLLDESKRLFRSCTQSVNIAIAVHRRANVQSINKQHHRMMATVARLCNTIVNSIPEVQRRTIGESNRCDLIQSWYMFAEEYTRNSMRHMEPGPRQQLSRRLLRLAVDWVTFVSEDCDPDDRKTFRWAIIALEFARTKMEGSQILALNHPEFAQLRTMVAGCMSLLITHVDIHGARSSFEARAAELERRQALEDAMVVDATGDKRQRKPLSRSRSTAILSMRRSPPKPPGSEEAANNESTQDATPALQEITIVDETDLQQQLTSAAALVFSIGNNISRNPESSLVYVRDEWARQLKDLEVRRTAQLRQNHIIGRVLDDDRPEDRDLVFLASSSSNISLRWQQGRYIGGGTFGSVYAAINMESGELMAVKEIRFQDASSLSTACKNIRDEMTVMEMLNHPNIVSYYGMEVHRDKVYLFMECCQGGSLASLLEHGRIEDENVVRVYAVQMLRGAAYLHANNIVHRDIKPDNILFDDRGCLKFVDFGAAKVLANNQRTMLATLNKTPGMNMGTLTGTPMYMAPEVITAGEQGRKGSQDIWSIGCCVLEMVTGHRPWHNLDNEWSVMYHVVMGRPMLPDTSQLSALGIEFLKCCFNRAPSTRATAQELLNHPWLVDVMVPETPTSQIPPGQTAVATPSSALATPRSEDTSYSNINTPTTDHPPLPSLMQSPTMELPEPSLSSAIPPLSPV